MTNMIVITLCALAGVSSLAGGLLLVQAFAATARPIKPPNRPSQPTPSIAVLVPAHNEESGIGSTLASIIPQLSPDDYVLVIADNCSDQTAVVAVAAGARVSVRSDSVRLGKGFALQHGMEYIRGDARAAIVVVDADTRVFPGTIRQLAAQAVRTGRPAQAIYLLDAGPDAGALPRVSAFAFLFKNLVRPLGFWNLGLPCQLLGTGMAFPCALLSTAKLGTADIVEDMSLGLDLAAAGFPPLLCPHATVTGELPIGRRAALKQRTRWEHGHLHTLTHRAIPLALLGLRQVRPSLFLIAMDLAVPPLAFLIVLQSLLVAAGTGALFVGLGPLPLLTAAAGLVATALAVLWGWLWFGRRVISLPQLGLVPFYILWKLPLYFKFFGKRQTTWVRTERTASEAAPPLAK